MFISFEGLDYCGKSTQVKLLAEYLVSCGKDVGLVREPGGTEFSEMMRQVLLHRDDIKLSPEAETCVFLAARAQLMKEKVTPWLEEGVIVICDRFLDSTIAYQGGGRGLDTGLLHTLNKFVIGDRYPDITFFITTSMNLLKLRAESRGKPDKFEREGKVFNILVHSEYCHLALNCSRIATIEGDRTPEAIHESIIKHIQAKMKLEKSNVPGRILE